MDPLAPSPRIAQLISIHAMKVCVYTIAKNEAHEVPGWLECLREMKLQDHVLVGDTGSTDKTIKELAWQNQRVERISIEPFRFDTARNALLALVPADVDICVALDMDERLTRGWRDVLEEVCREGGTRVRYPYVWSWQNKRPGIRCYGDKIHARHGYRWIYPVHEKLQPVFGDREVWTNRLAVHHFRDENKQREYLPSLMLAAEEWPDDGRVAHMLGREYFFGHFFEPARTAFERHVRMDEPGEKLGESLRYLARIAWRQGKYEEARGWAYQAVAQAPNERESWMELGYVLRAFRQWHALADAAEQMRSIHEQEGTHVYDPKAWEEELPRRFLDEARFHLSHVSHYAAVP